MTVQTERRTARAVRLRWYVAGPVAAAVCLPALLYACALLLARDVLPYSLMEELSIACVFLASAASGAAAAASRGGRVMQTGLLMGGAVASVMVIASLAAPGTEALAAGCARSAVAALGGGAFGGALCIKRGKRGASRRRRR